VTEAPLPSWPREYYQPGGGDARLFYKIHGDFGSKPQISRKKYRTAGVPAGCTLQRYEPSDDVFGFGLDSELERRLRDRHGELLEKAKSAPHCLVLRGDIPDPENLDYFRDVVGLVQGLLDQGGVAAFDPFILDWWSPSEWDEWAFAPGGAVPRHHAVILVSPETTPGQSWYHTRGMLKFGRPDISVHAVTAALEDGVEDLCNRFIEMMAFGAVVPDGQEIRMSTLPSGWRCQLAGDLDDPDFNNRHILVGP
jgi:hypothetical protein